MRVNQQPTEREVVLRWEVRRKKGEGGRGKLEHVHRAIHRLVKKFSAALGSRLFGASALTQH